MKTFKEYLEEADLYQDREHQKLGFAAKSGDKKDIAAFRKYHNKLINHHKKRLISAQKSGDRDSIKINQSELKKLYNHSLHK